MAPSSCEMAAIPVSCRAGWFGASLATSLTVVYDDRRIAASSARLSGRPLRRPRTDAGDRHGVPRRGVEPNRRNLMHCRRLLLSTAAFVLAASAAGATPSDDQIIKYYRKKRNVPPAQKVAVTGVKDSAIKGVKEGTLE